ncbi:MAG: SRPBCC domain-containing protein [Bryobacteraceae bacterium]
MPRTYEQTIEIDAPADAVWKAIAESEGIKSWFAPEARVEPGVGGKIWVSWGPECDGESRIEAWEPGGKLRYAYERPNGRGPNIVEFTIEAGDGAHTALRLVNSGFGDEGSFDAELETMSHAWGLFLFLLKYGVEKAYTTCRNISILKMIPLRHREALLRITTTLKSEQLYWDPFGEACFELPGMGGSLAAIFCEPSGESSMITIAALLSDADDARERTAREVVERLFDNLQATAASGA